MNKTLLKVAANHMNGSKLQQELLKSYLRKTSNQFICLKNPKVAEKFCEKIFNELDCDFNANSYLFEASPGYGILTEQLLKHSNGKIRVFEHVSKRRPHLETLCQKYGNNRMEIIDKQILDFASGNYRLLDLDREDFFRLCFGGLNNNWSFSTNHNQQPQPAFRLFTALSPFFARELLTYLVYSIVRFESFFESGPNEFYLFVPISMYKMMVSKPSRNLHLYTAFTIHMNTLFERYEINLHSSELKNGIDNIKIENRHCSIISSANFAYTNDRKFKSKEAFILIKLKPKPFINQMEADFLIDYVVFVKQSFMKRTNNAIKYYEKLFPGCTIDLIGLGISYHKTLGDLTSDEMFQIFSHVHKLPHYKNSIFKNDH